jgi:hypothetical protein
VPPVESIYVVARIEYVHTCRVHTQGQGYLWPPGQYITPPYPGFQDHGACKGAGGRHRVNVQLDQYKYDHLPFDAEERLSLRDCDIVLDNKYAKLRNI